MTVLSLIVAIVLQVFLVQAKSFLSEAVQYAVANSFNKTADLVHVVIETEYDENTIRFLDVADNLLVDNYWSFRCQIDVNNKNGQSVSDHNLWFIDSYEAFRRLLSWIKNYHRNSQLFHFIILKYLNIEGHLYVIQTIFSDFLRLMITNVYLMIETASEEVLFYTFYPFQELVCRSVEPSVIFQFNRNTVAHDKISFFPPKVNNFYGCVLRMKTRNYILLNLDYHEAFRIETVIISELASRLNFTSHFIGASPGERIWLNENSSGPHESFENGEIDMLYGLYANNVLNNYFFSISVTYIMTWVVIAFQYQPYVLHKYIWLFISFDSKTWTCLVLTLTIIGGCIFYVKQTRRLSRIVQFQNVGFLEILAVSIGASVGRLPRKNCLRFGFVVLSLGALVLRTAYLGKLFDVYRGLRMAQPPHGFNELVDQNYTIYSHTYYTSFIRELTQLGNVHLESLSALKSGIFSNARHKSALFSTLLYIFDRITTEERRNMIFEEVFAEQICIFFQKHSVLIPRVNDILNRLEEAGILRLFKKNYENIKNVDFAPKKMIKPLVFERFEFAFYLFIGMNAIACLIFAAELYHGMK